MIQYILHKLQEGFVVTSDEVAILGDICISPRYRDTFIFGTRENSYTDECRKVIAQQPNIIFSALSEEEQKDIGWFDDIIHENFKGLHDAINDKNVSDFYIKLIKNYTQELLSDKMFTLIEVKGLMTRSAIMARDKKAKGLSISDIVKEFEDRMKSVSKFKSWPINGEWINNKFKITHLKR